MVPDPDREAGRTPTPAAYRTDSVTPSSFRSFSICESASAIVQNGANPSHVAVRQNVWHRWPASARTTRYARANGYFHWVREKTALMRKRAAAPVNQG